MNEQTQPAFRIGGIYRDGADRIVRLSGYPNAGLARAEAFDGRKWLGYMNCFRLADGKWLGNPDGKESLHLLPGEVNEQGEPIAPTFYCAAETIKPAKCKCERCKGTRGGVPGNENVVNGMVLCDYCTGDKMRSTSAKLSEPWVREKLRPRLTWADSKAADRFPGFSSSSDTATPDHAYSHPLTRVADAGAQVGPTHGSAWLVG